MKYSNSGQKLERPQEDRIRFNVRGKHCVMCGKEATKMVSFNVKGGGALQLERYCDSCFNKNVDLEKMRMKV